MSTPSVALSHAPNLLQSDSGILCKDQNKSIVCSVCNTSFKLQRSLVRHKKAFHSALSAPFQCEKCGKRFSLLKLLNEHLQKHSHSNSTCNKDVEKTILPLQKKLQCLQQTYLIGQDVDNITSQEPSHQLVIDLCKDVKESQHEMERGSTQLAEATCRNTTDEPLLQNQRNVRCNRQIYEHEFANGKQKGLKEAINLQLAQQIIEKPFSCDKCQGRFKSKHGLFRHNLHVHTDHKLFQCNVCQKKFATNSQLKRHVKTHGLTVTELDLKLEQKLNDNVSMPLLQTFVKLATVNSTAEKISENVIEPGTAMNAGTSTCAVLNLSKKHIDNELKVVHPTPWKQEKIDFSEMKASKMPVKENEETGANVSQHPVAENGKTLAHHAQQKCEKIDVNVNKTHLHNVSKITLDECHRKGTLPLASQDETTRISAITSSNIPSNRLLGTESKFNLSYDSEISAPTWSPRSFPLCTVQPSLKADKKTSGIKTICKIKDNSNTEFSEPLITRHKIKETRKRHFDVNNSCHTVLVSDDLCESLPPTTEQSSKIPDSADGRWTKRFKIHDKSVSGSFTTEQSNAMPNFESKQSVYMVPYKCNLCSAAFMLIQDLEKHVDCHIKLQQTGNSSVKQGSETDSADELLCSRDFSTKLPSDMVQEFGDAHKGQPTSLQLKYACVQPTSNWPVNVNLNEVNENINPVLSRFTENSRDSGDKLNWGCTDQCQLKCTAGECKVTTTCDNSQLYAMGYVEDGCVDCSGCNKDFRNPFVECQRTHYLCGETLLPSLACSDESSSSFCTCVSCRQQRYNWDQAHPHSMPPYAQTSRLQNQKTSLDPGTFSPLQPLQSFGSDSRRFQGYCDDSQPLLPGRGVAQEHHESHPGISQISVTSERSSLPNISKTAYFAATLDDTTSYNTGELSQLKLLTLQHPMMSMSEQLNQQLCSNSNLNNCDVPLCHCEMCKIKKTSTSNLKNRSTIQNENFACNLCSPPLKKGHVLTLQNCLHEKSLAVPCQYDGCCNEDLASTSPACGIIVNNDVTYPTSLMHPVGSEPFCFTTEAKSNASTNNTDTSNSGSNISTHTLTGMQRNENDPSYSTVTHDEPECEPDIKILLSEIGQVTNSEVALPTKATQLVSKDSESNDMLPSKEKYQCKTCKILFHNKSKLVTHIHTHAKKKTFECTACNIKFKTASGLSSHTRRHKPMRNKEEPIGKKSNCSINRVNSSKKDSLNKASSSENLVDDNSVCSDLPSPTSVRQKYELQKKDEWEARKLVANHNIEVDGLVESTTSRPYNFLLGYSAKKALLSKVPREALDANLLNGQSSTITPAASVLSSSVPKSRTYECKLCSKRFPQQLQVRLHVEQMHRDSYFQCSFCRQTFLREQSWERHQALHKTTADSVSENVATNLSQKAKKPKKFVSKQDLNEETLCSTVVEIMSVVEPNTLECCLKTGISTTSEEDLECKPDDVNVKQTMKSQAQLESMKQVISVVELNPSWSPRLKDKDKFLCEKSVGKANESNISYDFSVKQEFTQKMQEEMFNFPKDGDGAAVPHERNLSQTLDKANTTDLDFDSISERTSLVIEVGIKRLLPSLCDEYMLLSLGWPDRNIGELLYDILQTCGKKPYSWNCLNENCKLLFEVAIGEDAAKDLLATNSVKEIVDKLLAVSVV